MTTATDQVVEITVYWDTQDPANEGWAYRVKYASEHEDSGPCNWPAQNADIASIVVEVAHLLGVTVTADDVATEPDIDGGYGVWTAE